MLELAENIWIAEGETVSFFCLPFSTRMTVVRLSSGDLWIHSPIKLTTYLKEQLAELGHVKYLIAPNHLHHLFLPEWCTAFPDARTYGTDEVIKKRKDIAFHGSLNTAASWPWQSEIDQILFSGSPLMQEAVFFHRASRTLLVTDLVENFAGDSFKPWQKVIAKMVGILAPNGKTPIDWRVSFWLGRKQAQQNLRHIKAWQPERLVMAHGIVIENDTTEFIRKSFSWLD